MTEQVHCNLCKNSDSNNLFSLESIKYVQCNNCGLVYANPLPVDKELEEFYSNIYHECREPEINRARFTRYMLRRLRLIEKLKSKGRILDIGCGAGYFLLLARQSGWEGFGLDVSKWASDYARNSYGLEVTTGTLKTAHLPQDWFDVVLLNHVLEHFPDPSAELNRVYRILKQSGIVVVDLPNFASLTSRVYRERWSLLMPNEHLYQFTPQTLCRLLEKAGFKVIKSSTVSGVFDFGDPSTSIKKTLSSLKLHHLLRDGFHYTIGKMGYGDDLTVVAQR